MAKILNQTKRRKDNKKNRKLKEKSLNKRKKFNPKSNLQANKNR